MIITGINHLAFITDDMEKTIRFYHVAFQVESREDLFRLKDRLEAAEVEVSGAVDHGTIWSIYFYDPNNIPLEASWTLVDVVRPPAMAEDQPMAIVAEGAEPQPGQWPEPKAPTPEAAMLAHAGNGHPMREALLREGRGHLTADAEVVLGRSQAAE